MSLAIPASGVYPCYNNPGASSGGDLRSSPAVAEAAAAKGLPPSYDHACSATPDAQEMGQRGPARLMPASLQLPYPKDSQEPFGPAEWLHYFGVHVTAPPIPEEYPAILNRLDPLCAGQRVFVSETHNFLVLVPHRFTLNDHEYPYDGEHISQLFSKDKTGVGMHLYDDMCQKDVQETSHWVLLRKRMWKKGEANHDLSREIQQLNQKAESRYRMPTFLEVAAVANAVWARTQEGYLREEDGSARGEIYTATRKVKAGAWKGSIPIMSGKPQYSEWRLKEIDYLPEDLYKTGVALVNGWGKKESSCCSIQ